MEVDSREIDMGQGIPNIGSSARRWWLDAGTCRSAVRVPPVGSLATCIDTRHLEELARVVEPTLIRVHIDR